MEPDDRWHPYINDGDWVESCTALVEHHSGELEILQWTKVRAGREAWDADAELRVLGEPLAA